MIADFAVVSEASAVSVLAVDTVTFAIGHRIDRDNVVATVPASIGSGDPLRSPKSGRT
jgi:hypothetical protein